MKTSGSENSQVPISVSHAQIFVGYNEIPTKDETEFVQSMKKTND